MAQETPISYRAAARGTPVLSSSGTKIGTLEHVLEVRDLDIFEGIVIATHHGLRFIDAEHLPEFTTTQIRSSLSDAQAAELPLRLGHRSTRSTRWQTPDTTCTTCSDACSAGRTGSARRIRPEP